MTGSLLTTLLWTIIGFASGSLMWSVWVGRWALGKDIRQYGDGNPGMTNVMRAGGKGWAALAFCLDVLKGALPVAAARWGFGLEGWALLPVALAPVLGHAFSPLLGFRGGKAVAVTMGVWTALTLWEMPTVGGILLGVWFSVVAVSGWAVLLMGASAFAYLLLTNPDPALLVILIGNAVIVGWKYRDDLRQFPALRSWIAKRLVRS